MIIILGGSAEAGRLDEALGHRARLIPPGASWTAQGAIAVIDAAHPCDIETPGAGACCATAGVPRLRLQRPKWRAERGDQWIAVPDAAAAQRALRPEWRRVFLVLNQFQRRLFANNTDRHFLARMRRDHPGLERTPSDGPFTEDHEIALLERHGIDALVAANAGGTGAWPKIGAARRLGLPCVLIDPPSPPPGAVARSVEEALEWLSGHSC